MTTEENKAVVRRFFEAFEADDQAALTELLAPDLVACSHGAPDPQGREAHLQGIRMWNAAFGDTHFTIHEQIAEGDKVATRVSMRSVHSRGDFQGLPPDRQGGHERLGHHRAHQGRRDRGAPSQRRLVEHDAAAWPTPGAAARPVKARRAANSR